MKEPVLGPVASARCPCRVTPAATLDAQMPVPKGLSGRPSFALQGRCSDPARVGRVCPQREWTRRMERTDGHIHMRAGHR
jgi:hypothetical protein